MSLRSLIAGVSLTIALLSGCSTVPESVHPVEWQQHQATLAEIEQFQVTGKLGYISPEQRQSLNFYWDHRPYFSELRFTTLLGQTALKLTMTPDGASIETYDDEQFTASDATSLIYQLTGLLLPVQQLPDWLLGLPEGTDQFRLSPQNTLASLDQKIGQQPPWHIEYTQYQDVPFAQQILPLPRKLKLIQSDTKLNIVVTKWTLTP